MHRSGGVASIQHNFNRTSKNHETNSAQCCDAVYKFRKHKGTQ